jgi:hypothetical protein
MRTLCALLFLSAGLFAQDQTQPQPSGKFYGRFSMPPWNFKSPASPSPYAIPQVIKVTPGKSVERCAVPLTEMKIPSGTNFVIGTVTPSADAAEAGAQAKSVLPVCSQR